MSKKQYKDKSVFIFNSAMIDTVFIHLENF